MGKTKVIRSPHRFAMEMADLQKKTIGFVPTMGALHAGHLALIKKARNECDIVVVSIFINPAQFGPSEDYDQYPRSLKTDRRLCEQAGVDFIFNPKSEDMYPTDFSFELRETWLSRGLCGDARPGHFDGVVLILTKLFNLIQPNIAYMGQKDYQQFLIVRKLAKDLNYSIKVKMVPTVRDNDGLALSSRNAYLSTEERAAAVKIYQALKGARHLVLSDGINSSRELLKFLRKEMKDPLTEIEYIHIGSDYNLKKLKRVESKAVIAVAARVGTTRLIDNVIV